MIPGFKRKEIDSAVDSALENGWLFEVDIPTGKTVKRILSLDAERGVMSVNGGINNGGERWQKKEIPPLNPNDSNNLTVEFSNGGISKTATDKPNSFNNLTVADGGPPKGGGGNDSTVPHPPRGDLGAGRRSGDPSERASRELDRARTAIGRGWM